MVELQVAVAKVPRHGAEESGDTLEMIERPGGGLSVVLVDGQGSGRGAKTRSNLIATRAIAQLKDGARDGVVARAVHDYLYTYRMGQVAATLNILSVDLRSGTVLVSRNNPAPFFIIEDGQVHSQSDPSMPIGLHPGTKPRITEIPLRPNLYVVVFTDGLLKAGQRFGEDLELVNFLAGWPVEDGAPPLAEALLARALEADHGEPADDISVVVLAALPKPTIGRVRRMWVSQPIEHLAANGRREIGTDEDLG